MNNKKEIITTINEDGSKTAMVKKSIGNYNQSKIEEIQEFFIKYKRRPNFNYLKQTNQLEMYKEELLELYNSISNSKIKSFCNACSLERYLSILENYCNYGTKLLKIEGYWVENEVIENKEVEEVNEFLDDLSNVLNTITEIQKETIIETESSEIPVYEAPKKKGGRPKKNV